MLKVHSKERNEKGILCPLLDQACTQIVSTGMHSYFYLLRKENLYFAIYSKYYVKPKKCSVIGRVLLYFLVFEFSGLTRGMSS